MEERCHPPNRKSCRTPAQLSICLLHFNEIPFRHIFQHIDGQTTGPKSFSVPIGQQLICCEKLPVIDYEPVDCSIPNIDRNLLSKDQQYLLDISNAIPWEVVKTTWQIGTLILCSIPDGYCGQPSPQIVYKFIRSIRKLNRNCWLQASS
ncbi:hypothetical protein AVEN_122990-1 [Araneus ventricosus]|uniref:Uncharacterized protein n=1 Tax=Araneus ventricosus TaxID=182803 RepID=A0A4Y2CUM3_ARAVE|nr:hypothetical protein AVEN_122990-1 [Araneus ventricosus]